MDYGELLQRAWRIVWNNKFMFVLGFLAALGSGGSGGGGGNSNFNFDPSSGSNPFGTMPNGMPDFQQFWSQYGLLIVGLIIFAMLLGIIFWLLRLVAQGGLISSAATLDSGEQVTFGQAFSTGTGFLGKMLGLNILMYGPFFLVGLIFFIIMASMAVPIISAEVAGTTADFSALGESLGIVSICFGILACLAVPVALFINVIYPFAQRGLVLREMSVVESVKHGWQVVRDNIGELILLILLFFVLGIVFGIVMFIVLIPFAFLAMGPAIISMVLGESFEIFDILLLAGGGICLGLVGAAVNSIMVAFRSTTVTLAYQEFTGKEAKFVE
ncbi:MAG: hypothetical protein GY943_13390 [Chloroflexi bacterium]|nr:hypothetical protein [Chloroflexota bacterium]